MTHIKNSTKSSDTKREDKKTKRKIVADKIENIVKIDSHSLRLNEKKPELVEIVDSEGKTIDIFESSQLLKKSQREHVAKSLKLSIEKVNEAFADLYKQYEETIELAKKSPQTGFEDIDWEGTSLKNILHGAGGFTPNFAYETTYVPTRDGKHTWLLVACNGEKREAHILNPYYNAPEIFGEKYFLPNTPIAILKTLWSSKSVYEFINCQHDPDPTEVFKEVVELSRYFVYYVDETRHYLKGLWIAGTYFFEVFSAFPYDVNLGIRESGKTTAMLLTIYLSYHGKEIFDPTKSSAFRYIETAKPSIGFDEVEKLYQSRSKKAEPDTGDIITLIDVGYREGASVPRMEWNNILDRFELKEYNAYCPKSFAAIEVLTESTQSRSLPNYMVRSGESIYSDRRPQLKPIPFDESDEMAKRIQECRDELYKCRLLYANAVKAVYKELKGSDFGIADRYWELWRPLFAVCKVFAPDQIELLKEIVRNVIQEQQTVDVDDISNALTSACLESVEEIIDTAEKSGRGDIPPVIEVALKKVTEAFNAIYLPTKSYREKTVSTLLRNLGLPKRGRKVDPKDRATTVLIPLGVLVKQAQRFNYIDSATRLAKYLRCQNYVSARPPNSFFEEAAKRIIEQGEELLYDFCEMRSDPLCRASPEAKVVRFIEIKDTETGAIQRVRACYDCVKEKEK